MNTPVPVPRHSKGPKVLRHYQPPTRFGGHVTDHGIPVRHQHKHLTKALFWRILLAAKLHFPRDLDQNRCALTHRSSIGDAVCTSSSSPSSCSSGPSARPARSPAATAAWRHKWWRVAERKGRVGNLCVKGLESVRHLRGGTDIAAWCGLGGGERIGSDGGWWWVALLGEHGLVLCGCEVGEPVDGYVGDDASVAL